MTKQYCHAEYGECTVAKINDSNLPKVTQWLVENNHLKLAKNITSLLSSNGQNFRIVFPHYQNFIKIMREEEFNKANFLLTRP